MTKFEALLEVYKVQNQINLLSGNPEVDLNDKDIHIRIENEAYNSKKYSKNSACLRVF